MSELHGATPTRRVRLGCTIAAASWLAGIAGASAAAALHSGDWAGVVVLWAVGEPLAVAAWIAPVTFTRQHRLAWRIGCLALALLLTVLVGAAVLAGAAMSGMIAGV